MILGFRLHIIVMRYLMLTIIFGHVFLMIVLDLPYILIILIKLSLLRLDIIFWIVRIIIV